MLLLQRRTRALQPAVSYCFKATHLKCLWRPWLRMVVSKITVTNLIKCLNCKAFTQRHSIKSCSEEFHKIYKTLEIGVPFKVTQQPDIMEWCSIPAGNYMFKVNNRNPRTRYEIYPKLTIKTPERRQ